MRLLTSLLEEDIKTIPHKDIIKLKIGRDDVIWQPRHLGDSDDYAYIIFRCKSDNCKTIYTYDNLIEMN